MAFPAVWTERARVRGRRAVRWEAVRAAAPVAFAAVCWLAGAVALALVR